MADSKIAKPINNEVFIDSDHSYTSVKDIINDCYSKNINFPISISVVESNGNLNLSDLPNDILPTNGINLLLYGNKIRAYVILSKFNDNPTIYARRMFSGGWSNTNWFKATLTQVS